MVDNTSAPAIPLWPWTDATMNVRSSVGAANRMQWAVLGDQGGVGVVLSLADACTGVPRAPILFGPVALLPCLVTLLYPW